MIKQVILLLAFLFKGELAISIRIKKIYKGKQKDDLFYKKNHFISFKEMLVIDDENKNLGKISKEKAIEIAQSKNLDLVLISDNEKNPVAKIVDFGKYKYELSKKKKNQSKTENKEIRLSSKIEKHDLEVKRKKAESFLLKGNRVKVSLRFRGREIHNREMGINTLNTFAESLSEVSEYVKAPYMRGIFYEVLLTPLKSKKKKSTKEEILEPKQKNKNEEK